MPSTASLPPPAARGSGTRVADLRRRYRDLAREIAAEGFATRPATERFELLESAAGCLSELALESQDVVELERALELLERAVEAAPGDGPIQGMALANLLSVAGTLYRWTRKRSVLKDAAARVSSWEERMPQDWRAPLYLLAFAMVPYHVAKATERKSDILNAIATFERARSQVNPGSGVHGTASSFLAELRLDLYHETGAPEHLQGAIDDGVAAADGARTTRKDRNRAFQVLASAMLSRFQALGSLADLDFVVTAATHGLDRATTPAERLPLLHAMVSARRLRFGRLGNPADLEVAVRSGRTLVEAAGSQRERALALNDYANALADRFGITAAGTDLRAALTALRAALRSLPDGTPEFALVASNLGRTLLDAYLAERNLRLLREAASVLEQGAGAGGPNRGFGPALHLTLAEVYMHQAARGREPAPLLRRALLHFGRARRRATDGPEVPLALTLTVRGRLIPVTELEVTALLWLAELAPRSAPQLLRRAIERGEEGKAWTVVSETARQSLPRPPGVPEPLLNQESWWLAQLAALDNGEITGSSLASSGWLAHMTRRRRWLRRELRAVWTEMVKINPDAARYVESRRATARAWMEAFRRWKPGAAAICILPVRDVRGDSGADTRGLAILALRPESRSPVVVAWERDADPIPEAVQRFTADIPGDEGYGFSEESWYFGLRRMLGDRLPDPLDGVTTLIVSPPRHGQNLSWQLAFERAGWRRPEGGALPVTTVPTLAVLQDPQATPEANRTRRLPWIDVRNADESTLRSVLFAASHPGGPLVVGNPERDLAGSESEASEIARLLGVVPLLREQATVKAVLGALGGASIIHLASHADLDESNPLDSVIRLADGHITARDLVNARSDADLVVLSACEGAATQTILGGEVAGLAHMFLRSGAGAVLAGLWRVDDHATAFLMTAFYRAFLGGADAVDALQQAVELTSAQAPWKLPYYWSGFVLAQSRSRKLLPGMAHRRSSPDKGG